MERESAIGERPDLQNRAPSRLAEQRASEPHRDERAAILLRAVRATCRAEDRAVHLGYNGWNCDSPDRRNSRRLGS